jgi:hypothetical protein
VARMSERSLTRKGRLTAICMLVWAIIMIGLRFSGLMQSGSRSPVSHVAVK